jgi:large subunit ribosomal protein L32
MAVPKRKTSKARRDQRRANWKIEAPALVECPQCHAKKLAHRVCRSCGYYDGREVIAMDKDDKK